MPKLFLKLFDRFICFLPRGSVIKHLPANAEDMGSIPGLGRFSGEENGNPYPVFLPGKSHRQEPGRLQSMGLQESDTTEQLSTAPRFVLKSVC